LKRRPDAFADPAQPSAIGTISRLLNNAHHDTFDFYQRQFALRPGRIAIAPSRVIVVLAAAGIEIEARQFGYENDCSTEEVIMLRVRQICGMVVLSSAVLVLTGVSDASAQKKLSYEDAYSKCKADLDRTYPSGSTSTTGRNTRGAACMKQMGYQLKKSGSF
jgi:hypothetical protein